MSNTYKLIIDTPDFQSYEYIREEKNLKDGGQKMYIQGPFMMAVEKNRNNRTYDLNEMIAECGRYKTEMIDTKRSLGELNHPSSPEINPERACHRVVSLRQEGNMFVGKSLVLNSPMGKIVQTLINDDCNLGVSTRSLGSLEPIGEGVNRVKNMKLVAIDCVSDPSCPKAFVNGILESKSWILSENGEYEEVYSNFERGIKNLPRKQVEGFLTEQILKFIKSIS